MIISRIVNEFGISRTVTGAIKDSLARPTPADKPARRAVLRSGGDLHNRPACLQTAPS
jgi:hypothetical protein